MQPHSSTILAAAVATSALAACAHGAWRRARKRRKRFTLFGLPGSGSFVVESALCKAGAEFTIVNVEYSKVSDPEFLRINPMGQVPALHLPDGTLMTESAAICIYLASTFPDAKLSPPHGTTAHAAFLRWMVYMAVNLYEPARRVFYAARYTNDTTQAAVEAVKANAAMCFLDSLTLMEEQLASSFVCGETMCLADAYLAMLVSWGIDMAEEAGESRVEDAYRGGTLPKLKAIRDAVSTDGVFGKVFAAHGLSESVVHGSAK